MPAYLLRIIAPNQPVKNVPLNRLMAIRAESGAKYMLLDKTGSQVVADLKLTQAGSTLVVEAEGQKMLYLNRFYNNGLNATFDSAGAASSMPMAESPVSSAPSSPAPAYEPPPTAPAASASEVAVSSSGGWGGLSSGGLGLGGSMGTILLGGGVLLGGAALASAGGKDDDTPANNTPTPDTTAPTITSVSISSVTGASNNYLNAGDVVKVVVNLSEAATISGATPNVRLNIGGSSKSASYLSGSGSRQLEFSYTIESNLTDADGISIDANSLSLEGASLKDAAGNNANISHQAVAANAAYRVDTGAPSVSLVNPTAVMLEASNTSAGSDVSPQLYAFGNAGQFVAVWRGEVTGSSEFPIFLQLFNADGTKTGKPVLQISASGSTEAQDFRPEISASNDGGLFVAWSAHDNQGGRSIALQKINSNFEKTSTEPVKITSAVFADPYGQYDHSPQLQAVGSSGELLLVWDGFKEAVSATKQYPDRSIWVQRLNSDGSLKTGSLQQLDLGTSTDHLDPQIAVLSSQGATAIAWVSDHSIMVQRLDANGSKQTPVIQLDGSNSSANDLNPQIAALGSSGAFVVAWVGQDAGNDSTIFVQKFSSDGSKATSNPIPLEAAGQSTGNDENVQLSALGNNGEFVVTWFGLNSAGNGHQSIFVQKFDATGAKVGTAPLQLDAFNETAGTNQQAVVSAIGSDGRFVVVWQAKDPQGNDTNIHLQRFDASGNKLGEQQMLEATGINNGDDVNPQVLNLGTDGSFALTWQGQDRQGDNSVFVQRFDQNGKLASPTESKLLSAGGNITLQSSEIGEAYFVHDSASNITKLSDITSLNSSLWQASTITSANTDTPLGLGSLLPGTYRLYSADAAGNLSSVASHHFTLSAIESVALTAAKSSGGETMAANVALNVGDKIEATVSFSQAVTVSGGTPSLSLNIAGNAVPASYVSTSSDGKKLIFSYTILSSQNDSTGIGIVADSLSLNGASIKLSDTHSAPLGFSFVADNSLYKVDNTPPQARFIEQGGKEQDVSAGITFRSSDFGSAYLVSTNVTVNNLADIQALTDASKFTSKTSVLPDNNTDFTITGLAAGSYRLYVADKAGNLSAGSQALVSITGTKATVLPDPTVVIFDLVEGVSSSHSSRTFDATKSYTIYVKVAAESANLIVDGGGTGTVTDWAKWNGANNLGNDDKIVLVGSGPVKGKAGGLVDELKLSNPAANWLTSKTAAAVKIAGDGKIDRFTANASKQEDLWNLTWSKPDQGRTLNTVYVAGMPVGLLTSQGLVGLV